MRLGISAIIVGTALISACGSEPTEQKSETSALQEVATYSAEAFFNTTSYGIAGSGHHAFSPDGSKLLIHSDKSGVFNVYAMDVKTGETQQLTQSTGPATFAISYFPADERYLYTFDGGGDELNQIYVAGGDVDAPKNLTPGEKTKAAFAGWTPDGSAFYITTNERDPRAFDLYRYNAQSYERELMFENTSALQISAISDDGRYLALVKPETSANANVYLKEIGSEAPARLITDHEGDIAYGVYDFTPDSQQLLLATNEHGEFNQAWAYDLASGDMSQYLSADWDISYVAFSPSGRYFYAGVNEDASTIVAIRDANNNNQLVRLPDLPQGQLGSIRFSPDETHMALTVNASNAPSNIYIVDLAEGHSHQRTNALNPAIAADDLVAATVERFASYDGLEIPGILYKPHQASAEAPVPALVWVHGGPGGQSRTGYSAAIQHLVNHGYAVYAINNRGSSGYGKTFFHLDDKKHGEADLGDVVASKGFLAAKEWIDGTRIGIIGGSYGGYMVTAALAFEPEVFDVGIDIFGVTNWVRTLKSIPPWWESAKKALYDEMGDPATDEERLTRISSLFHAENIIKPMLVVQGANDPRVLQPESDEIVEKVRANGVPVEYIVFPDEGHGFRSRANRITASEAYVRFLNQYLKGRQTAQADP